MSRKSPPKARPTGRRSSGESAEARPAGFGSYFLLKTFCTALAALVSAVFFAQLLSPAGLPAAMMGIELATLHANSERGVIDASGPGWTTLYVRLRDQISRQPETRQRRALSRLFDLVVEVERGQRGAGEVAEAASRLIEQVHPANLAARLAHAILMPAGDHAAPHSGIEANFELLERVLIEPPSGWRPTLHNRKVTAAWYEILSGEIRRKDVAAAAAMFYDQFELRTHFAALPIIQRELSRLADALDADGRHDDARQCRRWFVQLAVGLMRSETDSGTRLLCADLVARMPGIDPDAATAMKQLFADFHSAADAAPIDLTDPARTPSVVPQRYRAAVRSMIAAVALGLSGIGGALLLLLIVPAGAIRSVIGNRVLQRSDAATPSRSAWRRSVPAFLLMFLVAAAVPMMLLLWKVEARGFYSENWLYVAAAAVMTSCGHLILVIEWLRGTPTAPARPDAGRQGRIALTATMTLALVPLSLLLLPPSRVAWIIRWFDSIMYGAPAVCIVLAIVLFAAILLCGLPLRRVASRAVLMWCVGAVLGLMVLQYHRAQAGESYQQAVAAGRMDEVAARLGDDWQQRYLEPVIRED